MQMTYEEMHEVAQYLYQLLDDIDTAGDMAKSDDALYRRLVECQQAKKSKVVAECDGYKVTLRPLTANVEFSGGAPLHGAASAGTKGYASGDKNE